ncbi:aconitase family protein [Pandoraea pulmonicola]|uniref:2,3-dimethylmalate dehydratase large subunit n=1 Tax=Pandoraea pulmonicola TaxID=93221 RepID=A0AAJ5D2I2_PANPU|nr:aconitase family protein [Pandoraea pulmonicola]AJC19371.1 3-isopropylmalate dehydratase [Pandoraea pulmonicola]SUA92630.1 2,3-dimethylmalate dehydratase large subunit [Pandoraea pulmonicola]
MEDTIRFDGRTLFLSEDPAIVRRQLAGESIARAEAGALRDNVSTDEITPVTVMLTYDERLGRYPYVGFKAGSEMPIGEHDVRRGGFLVTVAGKRYGKGSSRESSPLAELSAGIRLIVAESFERIYQQNCDNIGILTTTDFGVLDRIQAGEAIPITEFLKGRDALTQQIIRSGGLLAYSKFAEWPAPQPVPAGANSPPRTLVEKIMARRLHPSTPGMAHGDGVFVRVDWRFSHDYFTGMCAHLMHRAFGEPAALHDPSRIIAFQDHLVLAAQSHPHVSQGLLPGVANLTDGHRNFVARYPVLSHGELGGSGPAGADGICHALMAERYALPGEIVIGTDSHTPHAGALGCLAFGAGATDIANSWVTGYVRCKVPQTLRIEIDGELAPGVTAKDVVLHLLRLDAIRRGDAIGLVFEYAGSAVRRMSVDERATLTNMVAELGGFTGIVAPDEKTVAFLKARRGVDFELEPWMTSDADAVYRDVIRIDAGALTPMLARPGDPGNGLALAELAAPVPIDIAYGGSCTAGKRDDFDAYHDVLAWGVENGLRVAPGRSLFLQFGTMDVRAYCEAQGYLETFAAAGATLVMPGCGACANCGPGQSTSADQVTISAINRNFPGRSGPGSVWLASPYTVAASALAGRIVGFEQLKAGAGAIAAQAS